MSRILRATLFPLLLPIALLAQQQLRNTTAYTTAAVRLRVLPAVGACMLAALPAAARVHVSSCSQGWCSVATDSVAGYLAEEFLTLHAPQAPASAGRGYINSRGQWVDRKSTRLNSSH